MFSPPNLDQGVSHAGAMRALLLSVFIMAVGCRGRAESEKTGSERVVQQVVDAWNDHDVDAALALFAPDVRVYRFPDKLLTSSRDSLGARWRDLFSKEPNARATVSPRIVHGRFVIDHESGSGLKNGQKPTAVWIYEVQRGQIVRAWVFPE
jgi:hypothetical protein